MGKKERSKRRNRLPEGYPIQSLALQAAFTTVSHRPLDEQVTHTTAIAEHIVFDYAPNTHSDSRSHFPEWPMNRSAMKEVARHTRNVNNDLAWIHQHFHGGETPEYVTAKQADEMASIGVLLPTYLVFRATDSIEPKSIPENVGDLYKIAQGIRDATKRIRREQGDDHPVTAEAVYERANSYKKGEFPLLVNEEVERVCPATKHKIEATTAVLLDRTEGNPAESELNSYVTTDEFPIVKEFAVIGMEFFDRTFRYADREHKLKQALDSGVQTNGFGQLVRVDRSRVQADLRSLKEELRQAQNTLQITYNNALGRDPSQILPIQTVARRHGLLLQTP